MYTLRESHRTRTAFRKVGGFVYVISVLISMEGCLAVPSKSPWNKVSKYDVYTILKTIFHTLTVAMRYEPANAKFFETEVLNINLIVVEKNLKKKTFNFCKGTLEKSHRRT